MSEEHVIVHDGIITCQFQRVLKLDNGPEEFLDLTSGHEYTVLAALQSTIGKDGKCVQIVMLAWDKLSAEPKDIFQWKKPLHPVGVGPL